MTDDTSLPKEGEVERPKVVPLHVPDPKTIFLLDVVGRFLLIFWILALVYSIFYFASAGWHDGAA